MRIIPILKTKGFCLLNQNISWKLKPRNSACVCRNTWRWEMNRKISVFRLHLDFFTSRTPNHALLSYALLCHKYFVKGFQAAAVMYVKSLRNYLNIKFHLKIKYNCHWILNFFYVIVWKILYIYLSIPKRLTQGALQGMEGSYKIYTALAGNYFIN